MKLYEAILCEEKMKFSDGWSQSGNKYELRDGIRNQIKILFALQKIQ